MNQASQLAFWPSAVLAAYHEQRHEEVSEAFLAVLRQLARGNLAALDRGSQRFIDVFVKNFLYVFTQEDYVPADAHMAEFLAFNPVISNVVALSSFGTTDAFIEILRRQTRNLAKMLVLYSARNAAPLDRRMLFDSSPQLATEWYYRYWQLFPAACAGRETLARLQEHLRARDERLGAMSDAMAHAYLGCTYVDCESDRELKGHINAALRGWPALRAPIANRPDFRKIAVITGLWLPGHAVYRCVSSFVRALAAEFELTLVHLWIEREDLDTALFREVRHFHLRKALDVSALSPNDWGIAFFPDIGLTVESIVLSNMRLAPIQVSCYGHPVSTFGSQIDYWIGGREIESLGDSERNYSERLVLVPGSGVAPNRPAYARQGRRAQGAVLFVNCPWTAQKTNFPLLQRLKRVLERSRRPIRFRFFTGGSLEGNAFLPFARELAGCFGPENIEVFDQMPYAEYMARIEQGDFNLDSYPFGGYATAADALYLGKPVVTWEGTKFYNRSAASLLRRLGIEELIVSSGEAYEALALRLVHDDAYRESLYERLAGHDLERTLFAHDDAQYVVKAFRYLVENRERLLSDGSRRPIVIDR
jgi:hypothetical protein